MNESLEAAAIIMAVIALLGIIDAGLAFAGNSTISNTSISYLFNVSNQTAPNMTGATKNLTAPAVVLPANLTANGIAASNALNITPLAAQAIPSLNSTANVTYIRMQGGFGRATVRPKLGKADISVGGTVVSGLRVRFRNQTMLRQFNISVTNESEISAIPPPQGQQVYQYIQINQSIYNSSLSIDPYISNVTYNFQVSAAWLSQQGVQAQNITLMKYDNSTMNWTALPTVLVGYNSSYYAYSSVSNSFSTYAIAYSYSNAIGSGAVKASLINNYNLYFYAGSTNSSKGNSQTTVSWTRTSAAQYTSGSGSSKLFRNATVGYSTSNSGTFTGTALSNNIVVELGFNAIEANGAVFSANTGTTATGTSNVLTFKTVTANSFVVIVSAVSNHTLAASGFKTTAPGNVIVESVNGKAEWAGIMVINSLAVGTYTVTTTASAKGAIAQSAFVFPTYSVTFNDFPTTANIATNGINQVNGNTISGLIGMGTINAIAPSGVNSVFSNWAFGGNLIVTDPTAQNTFLVVEGNDVLTANFNSLTTFTETGLPAGTTWNVV
ncbi:MAG: PGF-pre-PGF domain-containing protein, partial [Candidatus Micrarchaeota archaeon]|nr:PGF-pre-PGF domain-containing protein [Candidatus Micrarchaeota archaeon]